MELRERIGFFLNNLNIVQKLILYIVCIHFFPYIIDVVIYLFKIKFQSQSIFKWFYISADFTELIFKPWSIFTYGFFHNQNSFSHIFWNMFLFYYFGSIVLDLFGKKTLKHLFFSGIIVGGITYIISYNLFPVFSGIKSSMIGSSAGVSSIIFFLTFYSPNYKIRIFFFDLKLLYLAIFLFLYDIIQIPSGVRAQAVDKDGNLLDDFLFEEGSSSLHVLNSPSPAATASLAIGESIASKILN